MMCRDCQMVLDREQLDADGRCSVCAAHARGERPYYTVPRDEWDDYSPEEREAARLLGIHPE